MSRVVVFGDLWIWRSSAGRRGLSPSALATACRDAKLLMLRGVPRPAWRSEYLPTQPLRRIFIDVDPAFTQLKAVQSDSSLLQLQQ